MERVGAHINGDNFVGLGGVSNRKRPDQPEVQTRHTGGGTSTSAGYGRS